MIQRRLRQLGHLIHDPAFRSWVFRMALRRTKAPDFRRRHPPYLDGVELGAPPRRASPPLHASATLPARPTILELAGQDVRLNPADLDTIFERDFPDLETKLALHRFSWLNGGRIDTEWLKALWQSWKAGHRHPDDSWSWHPYTAGERAINIMAAGRLHGVPGTLADLAEDLETHARAIWERLEYFGDAHTGNHLSNNGRALFLIGIALEWPDCAAAGERILLAEAERIFSPSGILREGSSHYHLLVTRNYMSAWLAAGDRPGAERLEAIVRRAVSILPHLALDAGMPLIGDISPDCTPTYLRGLVSDEGGGWISDLSEVEQQKVAAVIKSTQAADPGLLSIDGWVRRDLAGWSGLWHQAPSGLPFFPGHGHQDSGGFELHRAGSPLFVDLGRGSYEERCLDWRANSHNSLSLAGIDPYPRNRAQYDERERCAIAGEPPGLDRTERGVRVHYHGFKRLKAGPVQREWFFEADRLEIRDAVEGAGSHVLERRLHTPWPAVARDGIAIIEAPFGKVEVHADCPAAIVPTTRWRAYGRGEPANTILFSARTSLPWHGSILVRLLDQCAV